jgi:hypothetical protein
MRRIILACLFLPLFVSAQRFGGTPPSVKWRQINTDSARIIFPQGLDSQAQRIASIIHYQAALTPATTQTLTLGNDIRKVNIVLQNLPAVANGYVGLGPYRSEFYLTPPTNNFHLGSIAWTDQLALHEYRHVQQFNNFHNGLSNLMYYLFGEEGYALAINASIPDWFYEGDAVYNETVLSAQGRGRLPEFMNEYPSLWKAGKNYSWMKLRNGSLKDYVPSHYNLGYLFVNYGRNKYGPDFWKKVTKDASAFKGLFYPFQKAIKTHAGIDYKTFRKDAFDYYKNLGNNNRKDIGQLVFPVNKRVVTNYLFPYSTGENEQVYLKTTFNKRPAFFTKDNEGEHFLRVKDISLDEQFSYRNGKIVYAAYETNPRWGWQEYSVIKLMGLDGRQKTLTKKTRYFTPDISPNGQKIAAVHLGTDGKSELHILDAETGEVGNRLAYPDINVFTDPKFMSDDSLVCAVRLTDGKMVLASVNLQTGVARRLTSPSFNVVGFPCVNDNVIYFTASYEGNDDVFAIKHGDPAVYRITNGSLGNYFVNVGNGKMTWSSFTAEGYQLRQADLKEISLTPVPSVAVESTGISYPVSDAEKIVPLIPGNIPARTFPVTRYRKGTKLLNFHSWRPYYEDPEFTFSIYGENVLNTLQTEVYYLYNENEKFHAAGFSTAFSQLFPYITAGTQYTFGLERRENNRLHQWDQLDSRIGLNVPLFWPKGQTYRQFNIGTNIFYSYERNKGFFKDSVGNLGYFNLQHYLNWSQQVAMAPQHIFPRLGYSVSLNYRYAITMYESRQFTARTQLYLPGIAAAHSIVLDGAFQKYGGTTFRFPNRIPYARGYNAYLLPKSWRISANYHFPVLYPDWGFGNILYLQRFRANGFFDHTRIYDSQNNFANQQSVGGEFFADTKWWNQHPLTFGFRVSYLLNRDPFFGTGKGSTVFEFILPVSIIPR